MLVLPLFQAQMVGKRGSVPLKDGISSEEGKLH
jgi:hypothetical protein